MSQTIQRAVPTAPQNEFDYRPVPVLAPVSLVIGICSSIGLLTLFALPMALIGATLAAICLIQIRRSDGALGGGLLAAAGFALSVLFFVSGSCLFAYNFSTEVPEGYRRVNFPREISMKRFIIESGGRQGLHPDVKPLVDRAIRLREPINNHLRQGITDHVEFAQAVQSVIQLDTLNQSLHQRTQTASGADAKSAATAENPV